MKAILLALLLSGCASMPGVEATPDEKAVCAKAGCTVWTEHELIKLARKFFNEGYSAGKSSI